MSALDNRRPLRVTCAAVLACLYAGVLVFVSVTTFRQLLSGAGTIGSDGPTGTFQDDDGGPGW